MFRPSESGPHLIYAATVLLAPAKISLTTRRTCVIPTPPREPSPVGGADSCQLTCLDCGRAQVLQSRLPLKNLLFTNKFGSKVAVDELPVQ